MLDPREKRDHMFEPRDPPDGMRESRTGKGEPGAEERARETAYGRLRPSVSQRWWRAARIGTVWGIGHGISVTAMVLALYALKGRTTGAGMSAIAIRGRTFL